MEEIWKDIEGYEGLYLVSNLGRIKSLSHLVISNRGSYMSKERIMTLVYDACGYQQLRLSNKGVKRHKRFIGWLLKRLSLIQIIYQR